MRWMAGVIVGIAVAAWHQAVPAADGARATNGGARPLVSTRLSVEQVARSDVEGSGASLGFREYAAGVQWQFLLLDVDHREYQWRDASGLGVGPGVDPWRSLSRIAPGLQYYSELGERWGVWAKLVAIAGFEDSISSRSWTYNPQLIGFHVPRPRVKYYAGLGVLHHPVDSILYPVLGIAWEGGAKTGLSGAVGFPETMVRYGLSEAFAVKTDFVWDIRFHQLAGDNALAPSGFVRSEDLKLGLQVEYSPMAGLTLSPGIRRYLGVRRSVTLFDQHENELRSHDLDASWSLFFKVDFRF